MQDIPSYLAKVDARIEENEKAIAEARDLLGRSDTLLKEATELFNTIERLVTEGKITPKTEQELRAALEKAGRDIMRRPSTPRVLV